MPQVTGTTSEDSLSIVTVYTGSANTTTQTFTFLGGQNAMTFRNKGGSVITLTVDGVTHKVPPLATIEIDDKFFTSFDVRTESGTQNFEIKSFQLKSSGSAGEDSFARSQIEGLNAQLAEKATKIELNDIGIGQINKNKGKLDQTYMSDTFLQQMAGTTPVNAVPADNSVTTQKLAPKAVDIEKLNFFEIISNNRFNPYDCTDGYYFDSVGNIVASASFSLTGFIKVDPDTAYYQSYAGNVNVYDANKVRLSTIAGNVNFTTPSNAVYIRTTLTAASKATLLICKSANKTYDTFKIKSNIVPSPNDVLDNNLQDFYNGLSKLTTANLYDKYKAEIGYYYSGSTGAKTTLAGYSSSDLIPVTPGATYSKKNTGHISYWSSSKTFVSGATTSGTLVTVPNDANISFIRITVPTANIDTEMFVAGSTMLSAYVPFRYYQFKDYEFDFSKYGNLTDKLKGLKWACLGDSITNTTYGTPYHQAIATRTGIVPTNYGVNQTSIAVRDGLTNSMLERYTTMIADADVITVLGGRNDITFAVPIGAMTDRVNNTLYGACHLLFTGLIEKYPAKKIGVLLPLQRDNDSSSVINYINAIKEVAEYYSLPVLDLYRSSGLAPKIASVVTNYIPDGLHPNTAGHEIISRRIEAWLRTL